jgi:excisionase family DNA binding protein
MAHGEQQSIKLAYGLDEINQLLGVGRSTLYAEIKAGRLPLTKIGRRSLVLAEDLGAYVATLKKNQQARNVANFAES